MSRTELIISIAFLACFGTIVGAITVHIRSEEGVKKEVPETQPYLVHTRIWEGCEYIAINRTPYVHKGNCTNHAGIK